MPELSKSVSPPSRWRRAWLVPAIGIALPFLCLALDPFVFTSDVSPVGWAALFSYVLIGEAISALLTWLILRRPAAFLSGVMAASAVFALCVGIVLLPFSLLGIVSSLHFDFGDLLLSALSVLGLSPIMVGIVYAREAWIAFRRTPSRRAIPVAAAGAILALLVPAAVQYGVQADLERVVSNGFAGGWAGSAERQALRLLLPQAMLDGLAAEHENTADPVRRDRLATTYRSLADMDIEEGERRHAD